MLSHRCWTWPYAPRTRFLLLCQPMKTPSNAVYRPDRYNTPAKINPKYLHGIDHRTNSLPNISAGPYGFRGELQTHPLAGLIGIGYDGASNSDMLRVPNKSTTAHITRLSVPFKSDRCRKTLAFSQTVVISQATTRRRRVFLTFE